MGRLIDVSHLPKDEPPQGERILRDAYDDFRAQMIGKGYSPSTIRAYDCHVVQFIDYMDELIKSSSHASKSKFLCSRVTKEHLIQWQGVLRLERGNKDGRKGGRAEKLQRILGHTTPEMTLRYVHFVTEDLTNDIDDFTI